MNGAACRKGLCMKPDYDFARNACVTADRLLALAATTINKGAASLYQKENESEDDKAAAAADASDVAVAMGEAIKAQMSDGGELLPAVVVMIQMAQHLLRYAVDAKEAHDNGVSVTNGTEGEFDIDALLLEVIANTKRKDEA
jgi:hypothetical protein